jgi:hypothetical protein
MHPTLYPAVNHLLADLLTGARQALGENFVALYLYGSLALGGFKPGRSDIDFLAVTPREVDPDELARLQALHHRIYTGSSPWARELEGSYISAAALRRYDPACAFHPHIDRGGPELRIEKHDTDWVVQRWVTREHGVCLFGPPPAALIDPIPPQSLRAAVRELFFFWWAPMAADPARLRETAYQVYAVLTMPRILYTFARGAVVSKPAAAAWALQTLRPRWSALLSAALDWEAGQSFEHLEETRELIRYTALQAG